MHWPNKGETHYHAQLGLSGKGRTRVGCQMGVTLLNTLSD